MTDEEKVRAAWELVHRCDGSYRHYPRNTVLVQEKHGEWLDFENWSAAAEFTAKREQAIAAVDEEIALLNEQFAWSHPDNNYTAEAARQYSIYQRILKSREAHRAELARGMKEKA